MLKTFLGTVKIIFKKFSKQWYLLFFKLKLQEIKHMRSKIYLTRVIRSVGGARPWYLLSNLWPSILSTLPFSPVSCSEGLWLTEYDTREVMYRILTYHCNLKSPNFLYISQLEPGGDLVQPPTVMHKALMISFPADAVASVKGQAWWGAHYLSQEFSYPQRLSVYKWTWFSWRFCWLIPALLCRGNWNEPGLYGKSLLSLWRQSLHIAPPILSSG